MFKLISSFRFIVPDRADIEAAILGILRPYYKETSELWDANGSPPQVTRADELTSGRWLNVKVFQKGTATCDDCLMFLQIQNAALVGPLGLLLMLPDLPIDTWVVSFNEDDIGYYGAQDTAPKLVCLLHEHDWDFAIACCDRVDGWVSNDCFICVTVD